MHEDKKSNGYFNEVLLQLIIFYNIHLLTRRADARRVRECETGSGYCPVTVMR
uniref:Uncharacterized protein n=1 Tax=Candidatus Berkiella aquae TaxID=295108 RepID=A0A0Q9Z2K6_9GAMM